jgi:lipoyl(octanoyl) transferase
MASLIENLVEELNYSSLNANITWKNEFIFIEKNDWDYIDCLQFQEKCVELIYKKVFSKFSIVIFTNHPSCLTLGRGLQKKLTPGVGLLDFDESLRDKIQVPIYEIKRGGGITFHHPGQLIIYPIINLSFHGLKVYPLMAKLFYILAEALNKQNVVGVDYCRDLLGLWFEDKKIASIGVQLRRFVSFHGIALNIKNDELIQKELKRIYPCGLPGSCYSNVNDLFNVCIERSELIKDFKFLCNELINEKNEFS